MEMIMRDPDGGASGGEDRPDDGGDGDDEEAVEERIYGTVLAEHQREHKTADKLDDNGRDYGQRTESRELEQKLHWFLFDFVLFAYVEEEQYRGS